MPGEDALPVLLGWVPDQLKAIFGALAAGLLMIAMAGVLLKRAAPPAGADPTIHALASHLSTVSARMDEAQDKADQALRDAVDLRREVKVLRRDLGHICDEITALDLKPPPDGVHSLNALAREHRRRLTEGEA